MRCTNEQAAKSVAVILASYPQRNVNNAEVYVSQLTTLIEDYPPEIAKALCHPVTGIVGRSKFLPTVAETKEVADELFGAYRVAHAKPKTLPPPEPEVSPEERQRRAKVLLAVSAQIRGTSKSMRA